MRISQEHILNKLPQPWGNLASEELLMLNAQSKLRCHIILNILSIISGFDTHMQ